MLNLLFKKKNSRIVQEQFFLMDPRKRTVALMCLSLYDHFQGGAPEL